MITKVLIRKIAGATLAAVAVAVIFSSFGYSDGGATAFDYVRELTLALASYVSAAFILQRITWRDNVFLDIAGVALVGSALSFPLKLIFLEGQNGIPAYLARAARDHSWRPYGDFLVDGVSFVIFAIFLSLPFAAIGSWLYQGFAKSDMPTTRTQ
jgi:hypothetical protein